MFLYVVNEAAFGIEVVLSACGGGVSLLVGLSLVGDSALVAASSLWSVELQPESSCLL